MAEVGRGGFAVVYRAWQPAFQRSVAIKVIATALDDTAMRRFERECLAIGALSGHPNIVTVHELGQTSDGRPFIVMEYLEEGALSGRLAGRGPVQWTETLEIGVRLAGALESAHRRQVLHRDVKPENVLMSRFGEPKLGDFGIARIQGKTETRSGVITASFAHAAPEIIEGARPGIASDVYSLGSTLYTLLAGSAPFVRSSDEGLLPMLARIQGEPVPDLTDGGVPRPVFDVIEQSMAKRAEERYSSAGSMGRALQEAQAALGRAVTTLPVEIEESAPDLSSFTVKAEPKAKAPTRAKTAPATPPPSAPEPPQQPSGGRRRWIPVLGLVVVAAVIGVVVVATSGGGGRRNGPEPGAGAVAYRDDFATAASGWTQQDTSESTLSYKDGQYDMDVKQAKKIAVSDSSLEGGAFRNDLVALGDVSVEADVTRATDVDGVFGLVCRAGTNDRPEYQALIDPTGFWGLYRSDGDAQPLTKGQTAGVMRPGPGTNHIRMDCVGGQGGQPATLRLFVNGTKLAEAHDKAALAPGRVGFIVATGDAPGLDVRYDNVVVRKL